MVWRRRSLCGRSRSFDGLTVANFAKVLGALFARVERLLVLTLDTKSFSGGLSSSHVLISLRDVVLGLLIRVDVCIVLIVLALKDLLQSMLAVSFVAPHNCVSLDEVAASKQVIWRGGRVRMNEYVGNAK